MVKNSWPWWLPYPSSILRAFVVGFTWAVLVYVLLPEIITDPANQIPIAHFKALFLGAFLIGVAHWVAGKLINSRPKHGYFSRRKGSTWEGFLAFLSLLLIGLPALIIACGKSPWIAAVLWMVAASYLYQGEISIHRFSLWIKSKFSAKKPNQPINLIEHELNQMKADLGLTKMKSVKKFK